MLYHAPLIGPYPGWKEADEESDGNSCPHKSEYDSSDTEQYELDVKKVNISIRREYDNLVASTFASLIEKDTNVKSVVVFFQQHLPLSEDEIEKLRKAETLSDVHAVLKVHFSFFCNFEVIKSLNKVFGLEENEEKLEEYVSVYHNFIITVYRNRVIGNRSHHGKNKVVLKLDSLNYKNYTKISTETLTEIKGYIVSLLNKSCKPAHRISPSMLALESIAVGCLELKFLTTALVCEGILQLSDKTRLEMFEMSITCIEVYTSTSEKVWEDSWCCQGFIYCKR